MQFELFYICIAYILIESRWYINKRRRSSICLKIFYFFNLKFSKKEREKNFSVERSI
jgi:hypothetical protein